MTPETLKASVDGVALEIERRANILRQMRFYQRHPATSQAQYSVEYMETRKPQIEKEIKKLKIIKIELTYLFELSRLT